MNTPSRLMHDEILRLYGTGREVPIRALDLVARFGGWIEDVEAAVRTLVYEGRMEIVRYWNPNDPFGRFWVKDELGTAHFRGGYEYVYEVPDELAWFVSGDFWIRPVRVHAEVQ